MLEPADEPAAPWNPARTSAGVWRAQHPPTFRPRSERKQGDHHRRDHGWHAQDQASHHFAADAAFSRVARDLPDHQKQDALDDPDEDERYPEQRHMAILGGGNQHHQQIGQKLQAQHQTKRL